MLGWALWTALFPATAWTEALSEQMAGSAAYQVERSLAEFDRNLLAIIARHQAFELQNLDAQDRNAA